MGAYRRVYDSRHLQTDCQERDQLRNPTLGNRVWATFAFLIFKKDVFCNLFNIQKLRASHDNLHLIMLYHLDNVEKIGSTQIGGQLPVSIWQFAELGNVTIRTIVTTESCVPISEDILVNEKGLLYMPLYIRLQYYYARPAEK